MATYFYQSNPNSTKQAWLASRKICDNCGCSKDRAEFRVIFDDQSDEKLEVCVECWEEGTC